MIFRAWSGVQLLLDRVANIVEEICQVSLLQLLIIAGQPPVNAGWVRHEENDSRRWVLGKPFQRYCLHPHIFPSFKFIVVCVRYPATVIREESRHARMKLWEAKKGCSTSMKLGSDIPLTVPC